MVLLGKGEGGREIDKNLTFPERGEGENSGKVLGIPLKF